MAETKHIAYAAGILDGEGCISIYRQKNGIRKRPHYLRILVVNTNKGIVDFLNDNFGGVSNKRSGGIMQQYYWSISGKKAADFLELVLPYLIAKKQQAMLAIEFVDTIAPSRYGMTAEIEAVRELLAVKIKELKYE